MNRHRDSDTGGGGGGGDHPSHSASVGPEEVAAEKAGEGASPSPDDGVSGTAVVAPLSASRSEALLEGPNSPAPTQPRARTLAQSARRAGVAVGGGTLIGVGTIFIPTPLHPIGDVMILGGVALLGIEFDAPKKAMERARDKLKKAVDEEKGGGARKQGGEGKAAGSGADGNSGEGGGVRDADATNEKDGGIMKRTARDFGRRVVLPFLDQVCGDCKCDKPADASEVREPAAEDDLGRTRKNSANEAVADEGVDFGEPEKSAVSRATADSSSHGPFSAGKAFREEFLAPEARLFTNK